MLRFGPDTGPTVIAALPLFEEANRTRAFTVSILRALADRGIAGALIDLPGTGESVLPTEKTSIMAMREAYQAAAEAIEDEGRRVYSFAVRSAALLDTLALLSGRWQLSPVDGAQVLRDLTRIKQVETGARPPLGEHWFFDGDLPDDAPDPDVEIAGNRISVELLSELIGVSPFAREDDVRIVRLEGDPRPADHHVPGAPLWRRAEPGNDAALADWIAGDIASWIASCGD